MKKKLENIVSFTSAEIKERQVKGEMRSDWTRAAAQPIPDGSDPDDAMEQGDWATAELPMPRSKVHASIRLDADMLAWFKSQGPGYQTKINAVLRSYFQQHQR
ncbi:BrnA antitoxin family protein [Beijerinckia sp. L45]|uniref:BrnA antitoxin family protein n=1 Tax=Beijerinckia sp. L45 TaxID=1641855 RepID=UPI00131A7D02|nr:BrnA antitoxin family protein [Beijerinckia sp. L45]